MYIVKILNNGEQPLEIHGHKQKLSSGSVVKGINSIDSFTFSLSPKNSGFHRLREFKTLVEVYNTNKRRYEFQGRVLYAPDSMDESGFIKKEAICESFLGYLCDSQQEYRVEQNWTVTGLLQHFINVHNSQVESEKHFTLGIVTVTDPNNNLYVGVQRENTWEALKKKLIDVLGGELQVRVVSGKLYLDYLTKIGETKTTAIALSRNMKAITREKNPTAFITRLIPLGAKIGETEERLTISSVNDGKNYIDDEQAIAAYGIHVGYAEFDDVTDASNLLRKGRKWLAENNKVQTKYSITALDLSLLGLDIDDFDVYNYYPIKNHLLGIDDTARVIKRNTNICEESKSTIEIGDNFKTLSDLQKEQSNKLELVTNSIATIVADYVTNQKLENKLLEERTVTTSLIKQLSGEIELSVSEEELAAGVAEAKAYTDGQISVKAGEINLRVNAVETTANSAQSTASNAQSTADKAQTAASNAQTAASNAQNAADNAQSTANSAQSTANAVQAELSLKIGRDENDQIVSMLNASADEINITSNRLSITSDNFTLTPDGHITAIAGSIGGFDIAKDKLYASPIENYTITWDQYGLKCVRDDGSSNSLTYYGFTSSSGSSDNFNSGELTVVNDAVEDINYFRLSCYHAMKIATGDGNIVLDPGGLYGKPAIGILRQTWQLASGAAVTSDKNKKNSIEELDDKYSVFFENLKPQRFKYNDGTSNRYHTGFIAQEVEEALELSELSQNEFAGIVTFDANTDKETKALRYEEFISLNTYEIQKLIKRVAALEKRIS